MSADPCIYNDDLLDALGRGFMAPELATHIEFCASCLEIQLVAGSLLDERASAMTEAGVPSAATIWWRMQLRRQQESQATARRSLMIGQALTLSVALILIAALFSGEIASGLRQAMSSIPLRTPLLLVLGTWLLLAPIGGWAAIRSR